MAIGLGMASVDLREKPCKDVELRKVVAYHKLNKSTILIRFKATLLNNYEARGRFFWRLNNYVEVVLVSHI